MSSAFYGTSAWRALRAEVLRRDPVCTTPGCGLRSVVADHIVQRSRGGADALGNLRGLCVTCHNQRIQGGEPRPKGCHADGTPRDTRHWWNARKNSSELGAATDCGASPRVSSSPARDRR